MSLYNIASSLFDALEETRALSWSRNSTPALPRPGYRGGGVTSIWLDKNHQNAQGGGVPTLELLEDCLNEIYKARCCGKRGSVDRCTPCTRTTEERKRQGKEDHPHQEDGQRDIGSAPPQDLALLKYEMEKLKSSERPIDCDPERVEFATALPDKCLDETLGPFSSSTSAKLTRGATTNRIDIVPSIERRESWAERSVASSCGSVSNVTPHGSKKKAKEKRTPINKTRLTSRPKRSGPDHGDSAYACSGESSFDSCQGGGKDNSGDSLRGSNQVNLGNCRQDLAEGTIPTSPGQSEAGRSSSLSGLARARTVRFLLEGHTNEGENSRSTVSGRLQSPRVAVSQGSHPTRDGLHGAVESSTWVCGLCEKRNEHGGVDCVICGRRRQPPGSFGGARQATKRKDLGLVGGFTQRSYGESDTREVEAASSRTDEEGALPRLRGVREVDKDKRNNCPREGGRYELASFTKMQRATEPTVKARLGLAGEIKSLLSAIRRR